MFLSFAAWLQTRKVVYTVVPLSNFNISVDD